MLEMKNQRLSHINGYFVIELIGCYGVPKYNIFYSNTLFYTNVSIPTSRSGGWVFPRTYTTYCVIFPHQILLILLYFFQDF